MRDASVRSSRHNLTVHFGGLSSENEGFCFSPQSLKGTLPAFLFQSLFGLPTEYNTALAEIGRYISIMGCMPNSPNKLSEYYLPATF